MISKAPETLTACKYFKDGGFDEYLTDIDMGTVVEVFDMGLSKGGYTGENKKGKDNLNFEREYESGKRIDLNRLDLSNIQCPHQEIDIMKGLV